MDARVTTIDWILTEQELPPTNEEAYSEYVLITHKVLYGNGGYGLAVNIARYWEDAISSDGRCLDKIAEIARSFGYVSCMDIFEQLAEIKTAIGR